jgi:hypothetical protein
MVARKTDRDTGSRPALESRWAEIAVRWAKDRPRGWAETAAPLRPQELPASEVSPEPEASLELAASAAPAWLARRAASEPPRRAWSESARSYSIVRTLREPEAKRRACRRSWCSESSARSARPLRAAMSRRGRSPGSAWQSLPLKLETVISTVRARRLAVLERSSRDLAPSVHSPSRSAAELRSLLALVSGRPGMGKYPKWTLSLQQKSAVET